MPLSYEAGDLLAITKERGVICHQVNTVGAIGGVNKAICDEFPGNATMQWGISFGSVRQFDAGSAVIANIAAQLLPGRPSSQEDSYETRRQALCDGLVKVATELEQGQRLFVPYCIGCGMAGDNWAEMSKLLSDLPAEIIAVVPYWAEAEATKRGYLAY